MTDRIFPDPSDPEEEDVAWVDEEVEFVDPDDSRPAPKGSTMLCCGVPRRHDQDLNAPCYNCGAV